MNIENKINGFTFAQKYRDSYRSDMNSEEKEEFRKLLADGGVMQEVAKTVAEQILLSVSVNDYFSSDYDFPSDVAKSIYDKVRGKNYYVEYGIIEKDANNAINKQKSKKARKNTK